MKLDDLARKYDMPEAILTDQRIQIEWRDSIDSPDGRVRLELVVSHRQGRRPSLSYRVSRDRKVKIDWSSLRLECIAAREIGPCLGVVDLEICSIDEQWRPICGEQEQVHVRSTQATLKLAETVEPFRSVHVIFRVSDDSLALRYHLPASDDEDAELELASDDTRLYLPDGCEGYENLWWEDGYRRKPIANLADNLWLPLVVAYPDGTYAAIMEASNDAYGPCRLKPTSDGALRTRMKGDVRIPLPCTTPWRVIIFADRPIDLIGKSHEVASLCPPVAIEDTDWIRPGKCIREVTLTTKGAMQCVDFAVEHGLSYILFDGGWYGPAADEANDAALPAEDPTAINRPADWPGLDLARVVRYAKQHDIGVFLYVNYQALERQLPRLVKAYAQLGIAGLKFGFVATEAAGWTRWIVDAVRMCAEHRLLVDIHDAYRPTGLSRTWPNLLTQEGVRGNEHMPDADHNVTLPFTRFCLGAGDYTICYRNPRLQTTSGHQLAMAVVYFSPLQLLYWYNRPDDLDNAPGLHFFDVVPTTWDQTLPIDGQIGQYVVVARRSGRQWFVGAMTGSEARDIKMPLSFLEPGRDYQATIYRDGKEDLICEVTAATAEQRFSLPLMPRGGAVVHLQPADSP